MATLKKESTTIVISKELCYNTDYTLMKNVLVTGSLAYDYIMDYPETFEENILPHKLKTLSVSFLVNNFSKNFGGVAGNISYNLSLLGFHPMILASSGEKDFDLYRLHLLENGVNINYVNVVNDFTANMFLMTDKNNCQIAGFYPGAMTQDEMLSLQTINEPINLVVISPTMPKAMERFVQEAKRRKLPYLYGPAQQIPRLSKSQLLDGVMGAEILICNDYELALIFKKTGLSKSHILKNSKVVVTTLGDRGSLIETKDKSYKVGVVKPKKIVDPTGAGDGFIAGFLAGYLNKVSLDKCGGIGATLATYAIENYGTQKHSFTIEELKKRYKNSFGKVLEL